jgi:hypothetical protein
MSLSGRKLWLVNSKCTGPEGGPTLDSLRKQGELLSLEHSGPALQQDWSSTSLHPLGLLTVD